MRPSNENMSDTINGKFDEGGKAEGESKELR